jgi:hypothetical protein
MCRPAQLSSCSELNQMDGYLDVAMLIAYAQGRLDRGELATELGVRGLFR